MGYSEWLSTLLHEGWLGCREDETRCCHELVARRSGCEGEEVQKLAGMAALAGVIWRAVARRAALACRLACSQLERSS